MRVIVNHLTAIRQKTGLGHHVVELVRCLRAAYPEDEFRAFPGPLVAAGMRAWGRLRGARRAAPRRTGPSRRHSLGRAGVAWYFRMFWASRALDLYHEPNYIPLPW